MAVQRFKTSAKCGGCVVAIGERLNKLMKEDEWTIDLKSPEKTLEVRANVSADAIMGAVKEAGYKVEPY